MSTPRSPPQPPSLIGGRSGSGTGSRPCIARQLSSQLSAAQRQQEEEEGEGEEKEGWLVKLGYKAGEEDKTRSLKERLKSGVYVCVCVLWWWMWMWVCAAWRVGWFVGGIWTEGSNPNINLTYTHTHIHTCSRDRGRVFLRGVGGALLVHLAARRHPLLPPGMVGWVDGGMDGWTDIAWGIVATCSGMRW